ncbi:MAG: DUF134 domain-containing protein [Candidatus Thermoplasmatota archaeon]|nr:DUF134 domain-containing protein [Candidatus Thermoplasmatota archaeon]
MIGQRRGRRRRHRWVAGIPPVSQFGPAYARQDIDVVNLFIEEFEAIRLVDLVGLSQVEAAVQMGISQKTLWNDLTSARRKVADAIVNGKAIRIEGGSYIVNKEFMDKTISKKEY